MIQQWVDERWLAGLDACFCLALNLWNRFFVDVEASVAVGGSLGRLFGAMRIRCRAPFRNCPEMAPGQGSPSGFDVASSAEEWGLR